MSKKLKCFISGSQQADTSIIREILEVNNVETYDLYDLSIGESFQKILKQKIREADFVLFIITEESKNIFYELGVCEGIGKQYFVLMEKDIEVPFYFGNKLFQRANLNDKSFLELSIKTILKKVDKNWKPRPKKPLNIKTYSDEIIEKLDSHLNFVEFHRNGDSTEDDLHILIEEIFKTLNLNYVERFSDSGKGADFALWSDNLSRIIGNPIIVKFEYGNISDKQFENAANQIINYTSKSDAELAILLYLDKNNKRFKTHSSLNPLIIGYDIEDFLNDLKDNPFGNIVLNQRNRIAHGIE